MLPEDYLKPEYMEDKIYKLEEIIIEMVESMDHDTVLGEITSPRYIPRQVYSDKCRKCKLFKMLGI
jgi:hypothetical protein